jgi:hypothetical protein
MRRIVIAVAVAPLFAVSAPFAADNAPSDTRQFVDMPAAARELMRQEMLDNLGAITEIIGDLADGKLDAAATAADLRLGSGSMGRYMGNRNAPGRYMPQPMHAFGFQMHDDATEFAAVARKGDIKAALAAFQKITADCVGCHATFRTR